MRRLGKGRRRRTRSGSRRRSSECRSRSSSSRNKEDILPAATLLPPSTVKKLKDRITPKPQDQVISFKTTRSNSQSNIDITTKSGAEEGICTKLGIQSIE